MNLLLVNHYAGSPRHGMEYRPYYLGREWVRRGHEVQIVAASYSHARDHQPALPEYAGAPARWGRSPRPPRWWLLAVAAGHAAPEGET